MTTPRKAPETKMEAPKKGGRPKGSKDDPNKPRKNATKKKKATKPLAVPLEDFAEGLKAAEIAIKDPSTLGSRHIRICGAKKRSKTMSRFDRTRVERGEEPTEFCGNPAGLGTTHLGYGRCRFHAGNTEQAIASAEKEMVQDRMAKEASLYGLAIDVGPHEALIQEVQRTAGHVHWLQDKIRQMDETDLTQHTAKDGSKASEWMLMYQEERKMLVSVCKVAIQCGIAERAIRLAEDQGRIIAAMFIKFINDERLDLTPEQRVWAPKLARSLLLEIGSPHPTKKVIGSDIIDVNAEEDKFVEV